MGADGSVMVYDWQVLVFRHKEVFKKDLLNDWPYLRFGTNTHKAVGLISLGNKDYLLRYCNTEHDSHDMANEFWCKDEAAHTRVMNTLEEVGVIEDVEVWT